MSNNQKMDTFDRIWSAHRAQSRSDRPGSAASSSSGILNRSFGSHSSLRSTGGASGRSIISGLSRQRGGAMSSQTRRILQELERISSPVGRASESRLPRSIEPERQVDHGRTLSDSRPSTSSGTGILSSPGRIRGPPLATFHTPTRAEILPRAASLSASAHPYLSARRAENIKKQKEAGGKIKSGSSRFSYGIADDLDDMETGPNMPSIPLPISSERVPNAGFLNLDRKTSEDRYKPSTSASISLPLRGGAPIEPSSPEGDNVPEFSFSKPRSVDGLRAFAKSLKESVLYESLAGDRIEEEEKEKETEEKTGDASTSSEDSYVSLEMESKDSSAEKVEEPAPSIFGTTAVTSQKWKCSDCRFNNHQSDNKCSQCLRQKTSSDKKWKCQKCTLENAADVDKCISCQAGKDYVPPKRTLTIQKTDKWTCSECWISNDPGAKSCVACQTPNPAMKTQALASSNSGDWWKCGKCMLDNKAEALTCLCCKTDKNYKKTGAQNGAPLKAVGDEKWTCDGCWIKNESKVSECVACGSVKPGTAPPAKKEPVVNGENSSKLKTDYATAFAPASNWSCTACFVKNLANSQVCHACSVAKPVSSFSPVTFGVAGAVPEQPTTTFQPQEVGKASLFPSSLATTTGGLGDKKSVRFAADTTSTSTNFGAASIVSSSTNAVPNFGVPAFGVGSSQTTTIGGDSTNVSAPASTSGLFGLAAQPTTSAAAISNPTGISFGVSASESVTTASITSGTTPAFPSFASNTTTSNVATTLGFGASSTSSTSGSAVKTESSTIGTVGSSGAAMPSSTMFEMPKPTVGTSVLFNKDMFKSQGPVATMAQSAVSSVAPTFAFGQISSDTQPKPAASTGLFFGKKETLAPTSNLAAVSSGAATMPAFSLFSAKTTEKKPDLISAAVPLVASTASSNLFKMSTTGQSGKRSAGSDSDEPSAKKTAAPFAGFGEGLSGAKKAPVFSINAFGSAPSDPVFNAFGGGASSLGNNTTTKPEVTANFTFGASTTTTQNVKIPLFGSRGGSSVSNGPTSFQSTTEKQGGAPALSFGFGNSGPAAAGNSISVVNTGFQFGAPSVTTAPPTFSFGAPNNATSTIPDPAAGLFQFGAGSGAAQPNPTAVAGDNPFNVATVTGNVAASRPHLKARRKIPRR